MDQAFESFFGWFGAGEDGTSASLLWSADPHIQLVIVAVLALALAALAFIYVPFTLGLVRLAQLSREVTHSLADEDPSGLPARRGRIDDAFLRSPIAAQWETFLGRWRGSVVPRDGEERAPVRLSQVFEESPALPSGARKSLLPILPGLFLAAGSLGALVAIGLAIPSASQLVNVDAELRVMGIASSIELALHTALWGLMLWMGAAVTSRWIEGRYDRSAEQLDQLVARAYGYAPSSELPQPQAADDLAALRGELAQMLDARFAVQAGAMSSLRELVAEMEKAPKKLDLPTLQSVAGSIDSAVGEIRGVSQGLNSVAREVDSKLEALRLVSASLEEVASRAGGDQEARKNAIDLLHELSDGLRGAAAEVKQTLGGAGLVGQREADLAQQRSFFEDALGSVANSIAEQFGPIDGRMQQMSAELAASAVAVVSHGDSEQNRIEAVAGELSDVVTQLRGTLDEVSGPRQRREEFEAQRDMIEAGLGLVTTSVVDRLAPIDQRLSLLGGELSKLSTATSSAADSGHGRVESIAGELRELGSDLRERLTTLVDAAPSAEDIEAQRQLVEESLANRITGSIAERLSPIDDRLVRLGSELGAASAASIKASTREQASVADATTELRAVATDLRSSIADMANAGPSEEDLEARRQLSEESLANRITGSMDLRLAPMDDRLERIVSDLASASATSAALADREAGSVELVTAELQRVAGELRTTIVDMANAGPSEEDLEAQRQLSEESLANRITGSMDLRFAPMDDRLERIVSDLASASATSAALADREAGSVELVTAELQRVAGELRTTIVDMANAGPSEEDLEARRQLSEESLANRITGSMDLRLAPIDDRLERIVSGLATASATSAALADREAGSVESATADLQRVGSELRTTIADMANAGPSEEDLEARRELGEESLANRITGSIESRLAPIDDRLARIVTDLVDARPSEIEVEAQRRRLEEGFATRVASSLESRLMPIDEQLQRLGSAVEQSSSARDAASDAERNRLDAVATELRDVAFHLRAGLTDLAAAAQSDDDSEAQRELVEESLAQRVSTVIGERLDPVDGRLEQLGLALAAATAATGSASSEERNSLAELAGELRDVASQLRESMSDVRSGPSAAETEAQRAFLEDGVASVTAALGERLGPIEERLQHLGSEVVAATSSAVREEQSALVSVATELGEVALEVRERLSEAINAGPNEEELVAQRALIDDGFGRVQSSIAERFDPVGERLDGIRNLLAEAAAVTTTAAEAEQRSVTAVTNELREVADELRETLNEAVTAGEEDSVTQRTLIEEGLTRVSTSIGERLGPIDDRLERMSNELAAAVAATSETVNAERGQVESVASDLRSVASELREALAETLAAGERAGDSDAQRSLLESAVAMVSTQMADRIDPIDERLGRLSGELAEAASAVGASAEQERSSVSALANDLQGVTSELRQALETASTERDGDADAQLTLIEEGLARVTAAMAERLDPIDERLGRLSGELAEAARTDDVAAQRGLIEQGLARVDSSIAERFDPINQRLESMGAELVAVAAAAASDSSQEQSLLEASASDLREISDELRKSLEPAHGLITMLDEKTTGFFGAVNDLETHVERAERNVAELRSGVGDEGKAVRDVTHELKQQIEKMAESLEAQQKELQNSPKAKALRASAEHERSVQKALERARKVKSSSRPAEDDEEEVVAPAAEAQEPAPRRKADIPDLEAVRADAERNQPAAVADPEGSRPSGLSSLLSSKRPKKGSEGKS